MSNSNLEKEGKREMQLTAQCLCKAQTFTTPLSPSDLPLSATACHCDSCRYLTGSLYTCDVPWPGDVREIQASSSLQRYKFSERVNLLFCGACSSPLFFEEYDIPGVVTYGAFTGVLQFQGDLPPGKSLVILTEHGFVGDTLDGGAAPWLRRPNGPDAAPARVFLGKRGASQEIPYPTRWPALDSLPTAEKGVPHDTKIGIKCHCGGVNFVFRAGEAQHEFRAAKEQGIDLGALHWAVVDPRTHKGKGSLDACESCRRMVGVDVTYWTFPYLKHISFATGDEDFPPTTFELRKMVDEGDARVGTLKYFASSQHVQRYFCGTCSASVFYAVDHDSEMVNLPIGLLRSPAGARAEGIISWSWGRRLVFRQDMLGGWREGFLEAVEREAEEWRVERGYPKNWRRVRKEEEEDAARQENRGR